MTYPLFCLYNRLVPHSIQPLPLKAVKMSALSLALLSSLRSDCASLRLICSGLSAYQVRLLARMVRDAGDEMSLDEYQACSIESKVQELSYIATI